VAVKSRRTNYLMTIPTIITALNYVCTRSGFSLDYQSALPIHFSKDEIHSPNDGDNIGKIVISSDHIDCTKMSLVVRRK
jgi:hypothetical protein